MDIKLVDEKPEILHELRRRVSAYKRLHPNLTSQQIAKRFGMSNSTFNRIENMELKRPTFDQIVKILKGVGAEKDLVGLLKVNYPDIMESIENIVEDNISNEDMPNNIVEMMSDDVYGKLMRLVRAKDISESYIVKEFGEDGLRKAEWLYLNGYITKKDENTFIGVQGKRSRNFEAIKKLATKALEQDYDAQGAQTSEALNHLSYTSGSVNAEKVLPLIISELEQTRENIVSLMNQPENAGDERVWFSLASDTVLKNRIRKKSGNQYV